MAAALMPSPLSVLLLDLGKVLVDYSHRRIAEGLARHARAEAYRDPDAILREFFLQDPSLVTRFDEGRLSAGEFFRQAAEHLGLDVGYEEFLPLWNDIFREIPEVTRLLPELRRRCRLFLISNTNVLHFHFIREHFPFVHEMDAWILSYETGARKPHPRIYLRAVERARVPPERMLLVDDRMENVEGARRVGLQAVRFTTPQALREELARRGLL